MSSDGHGIPDAAAVAEHQFLHRVESEEHEESAARKRGLPDEAVRAEYQFLHQVESDPTKPHGPEAVAAKSGLNDDSVNYEHEFMDSVERGGGEGVQQKVSKTARHLRRWMGGGGGGGGSRSGEEGGRRRSSEGDGRRALGGGDDDIPFVASVSPWVMSREGMMGETGGRGIEIKGKGEMWRDRME